MSEATNNLLPPAVSPQAITLARYYAKRAVKAAWVIDASDLTKAATTYLSEHRATKRNGRSRNGKALHVTEVLLRVAPRRRTESQGKPTP
jgi:hypothetical protein